MYQIIMNIEKKAELYGMTLKIFIISRQSNKQLKLITNRYTGLERGLVGKVMLTSIHY